MAKITIKKVKDLANVLNVKVKWSAEWQEWEIEGYHTSDHEDAIYQVAVISVHRRKTKG